MMAAYGSNDKNSSLCSGHQSTGLRKMGVYEILYQIILGFYVYLIAYNRSMNALCTNVFNRYIIMYVKIFYICFLVCVYISKN
jgi:hypothetical protein